MILVFQYEDKKINCSEIEKLCKMDRKTVKKVLFNINKYISIIQLKYIDRG
jgi:hypothetical protein